MAQKVLELYTADFWHDVGSTLGISGYVGEPLVVEGESEGPNEHFVRVARAPEPHEIFWKNFHLKTKERMKAIAMSYTISLVINVLTVIPLAIFDYYKEDAMPGMVGYLSVVNVSVMNQVKRC